MDRDQAQRRVDRIRAFREELAALEAEGLEPVAPAARDALAAHHERLLQRLARAHDIDRSPAARQLSRGMQVAAFFAAVTLTAAIVSMVARVWGRLDLPAQASLLCAFPLAALAGVELSARRERTLYVASIFALVAFGTFWLAVVMLGMLLDVPMTPPAIWAGALFGLMLALPYGFRLVLGLALGALLVALAGSIFQLANMPWTLALEHLEILAMAAFLLTGLAGYLGVIHPSFAAVTRLVGFGLGLVGLLVLSSAGSLSLLPMTAAGAEALHQALMFVASALVLGIAIWRRWNESVYVAATALTIFLFVRFVDWFWDAVPRDVFFLLLAALAFTWLLVLRRVRTRMAEGA